MNTSNSHQAKFSLVIPCYNEAKNIPFLFKNVVNEIGTQIKDLELILVDNGSSDNSETIMQNERKKYPYLNCKIVRIQDNQGYGYGIVTGLKQATADILSWTHADLQTDISDVTAAFTMFQTQANKQNIFIKGSRQNRSFFDSLFTACMSGISSFLLKSKLTDINAQPKMFHRSFFDSLKNFPDDFSLDLYFYLKANQAKFDILTIPVTYKKRLLGEAKGGGSLKNKFKLTKRTLTYILQTKKYI